MYARVCAYACIHIHIHIHIHIYMVLNFAHVFSLATPKKRVCKRAAQPLAAILAQAFTAQAFEE